MIRLILNADDLGLTPALSEAVVALRSDGAITDVSFLSVGAAFEEGVALMKIAEIKTAGVHLCLVGSETPVCSAAKIPSLVAGGRFRDSWPAVALAAVSGRIKGVEVEREWEAQIARVQAAGLRVTHLDGHQHLHLLPSLLPIAIRLAKRFGISTIRAPRADDPAAGGGGISRIARLRAGILARFGHAARMKLRAAGLPEPPRVLGLAEAGRMTSERWAVLLAALPDDGDFEVALHPGAVDEAARARYRWGYCWGEESAALRSPELRTAFAGKGIQLISFNQL